MRKYLLIDIYAQNEVIAKPNTNTDVMTINMVWGVTISISSGSYFTSMDAMAIRIASAKSPAKIPIHMLRRRNGRRMNPQLAPTSFMV